MKTQMLLRRTLYKTNNFFHKTLKHLKSLLFGGYQKLPKPSFVNPFFSASNSTRKMQELDDFYRSFSQQWAAHNLEEHIVSPTLLVMEDGECSQATGQNAPEKGCKHHEGESQVPCYRGKSGSSQILVHRMKEFDMFDVDDVDHQLDIEEVIHYYSRLTCPFYVDIVDNFFMDMYSEFILPHPSVSVNSSMRRLGPVKL